MALVDEGRVARLVPRVLRRLPAALGPRPMLDRLVGQDAEGRNDVFLEVLVLVVAPDQDDVRRELVELPARAAEARDERLAMALRGGEPLVSAVLPAHGLGPAVRAPVTLGEVGVLEHALEDARHVLVLSAKRRVVGDSEAQDRAHSPLLINRHASAGGAPAPRRPAARTTPGWYHPGRTKESRHDDLCSAAPALERRSPGSAPRALDAAHARRVAREGAAHDQASGRRRRDPRGRPAAISGAVPRPPRRTHQRDVGAARRHCRRHGRRRAAGAATARAGYGRAPRGSALSEHAGGTATLEHAERP